MLSAKRTKVAVIGARGIGKHHAKWYSMAGCDVVAFAGTTEESCQRTADVLRQLFGFQGRGYWDIDEMLEREKPDIVDVCSPHELHKEHALRALDFGAHVMCEKPLVWDKSRTSDQILADGREIVEFAKEKKLALGVTTQYVASLPPYRSMYEKVRGSIGEIESLYSEMDSVAKNGGKEYEDIWIDMASHPLSLLLAWVPDGSIDPESISCTIGQKKNHALFNYLGSSGMCSVEIVLRTVPQDMRPARRFGVNGFVVDWEGRSDDKGIYRAFLSHGGDERVCDDFMYTLLAQFVSFVRGEGGEILVTGETGLRNLELQLEILGGRCR